MPCGNNFILIPNVIQTHNSISFHCIGSHAWSTLANRLHDPGATRASFELLNEEMVFVGQCEGAGEEITFGGLHVANIPFEIFPVSFEVFHHEVFASQL